MLLPQLRFLSDLRLLRCLYVQSAEPLLIEGYEASTLIARDTCLRRASRPGVQRGSVCQQGPCFSNPDWGGSLIQFSFPF